MKNQEIMDILLSIFKFWPISKGFEAMKSGLVVVKKLNISQLI